MKRRLGAAGWRLFAMAVAVVAMVVAFGAFRAHGEVAFNRWVGWATVAAVPLAAAGLVLVLWDKAAVSKTIADAGAKLVVDRRTLLNRVSRYVEELQQALIPEAAHLDLRLDRRLDLVKPSRPVHATSTLSAHISGSAVSDYFDKTGNRLVILGAPGSGKTSILANTANDLIAAARADEREPIPVYLNLVRWTGKDGDFYSWLIEAICHDGFYETDEEAARWWLDNDQIVLLLDGLDEAAERDQADCYESILDFRKFHGLTRIILCCRTNNFLEVANSRRDFNEVLEIRPPTREEVGQILLELERRGIALSDVRAKIETDNTLRQFLMSPLVLGIVALAYMGDSQGSAASLMLPGSIDERLARLWNKYVQKMFTHRPLHRDGYGTSDAIGWLEWLAHAMVIRKTDEFQLDRFNSWPRFQRDTRTQESLSWRVPSYYRRPFWYGIGTFVYLPMWLLSSLALISYPAGGPFRAGVLFGIAYLIATPNGGLVNQILIGALSAVGTSVLIGRVKFGSMDVHGWPPVEKVHWSRTLFISNLGRGIEVGLTNGAVAGLIAGVKIGVLNGFRHGLILGALVSVASCLTGGLTVGPDTSAAMEEVRPDFGAWRSLRNAVWIGGMAAVLGLAVGGLLGRAAADRSGAVAIGIGCAIGLGLNIASRFGAGTWYLFVTNVDHMALARCGPWRYGEFLQAMTERLLLRRIGRSYAFAHIELRNHFAANHRRTGFVESGMTGRRGIPSRFDVQLRTGVWSRFQPDARKVLTWAGEEARQRKSDGLEPGHILLAFCAVCTERSRLCRGR